MSEVTNLVRMDLWKIASLGKNLAVYVVVLLVFFQFQMGLVAPVPFLGSDMYEELENIKENPVQVGTQSFYVSLDDPTAERPF